MGCNTDNILFVFFSENFLSSTSIVPGQSSAGGSLGIFFRSWLPAL